jgi:hypothetical protein
VFLESKLRWEKRQSGHHTELLALHRELLRLRREDPLLADCSKNRLRVDIVGKKGLSIERWSVRRDRRILCLFNFSAHSPMPLQPGHRNEKLLLAGAPILDCVPPQCFAVFEQQLPAPAEG